MNNLSAASLLINGKEAFPEILRCIRKAQRSVLVHMFLWRADAIGMEMARQMLHAADRGVEVSITVDRYALLLERCEECGMSFFHQNPTLKELLQILFLRVCYRLPISPGTHAQEHKQLLARILSHKNIRVHRDRVLADHSKYYIIDDELLFLGGINIEDKENGQDLSGRVYYDYMVKLEGRDVVEAFRSKIQQGVDREGPFRFAVNTREPSSALYQMKEEYLSIIRSARKELTIVMAYFSYQGAVVEELAAAARRGVRVRVMLPEHANFQDQANRRTARLLLKKSGGAVSILFSPRMIHTKLVYSEQHISLGSCNITGRAFRQLCELNLTLPRTDSPFCRRLLGHVEEECVLARPMLSPSQIRCHPLSSRLEGFLG